MKADLHIHTTASDGKLTPARVVEYVLQTDLDVIAITDHDTMAGVGEAREAARGSRLTVLPGVEISTLMEGMDCHILAYGLEDQTLLAPLLAGQKTRRIERARRIIENLNRIGFDISYEEVRGEAGAASIGRPHIARVLIRKGYAATHQEVFMRYLGNRADCFYQTSYPDTLETMALIHQAGGYAILAHPAQKWNFIDIKKLKDGGLDGIECYHPSHNSAMQRRYVDYCTNYGLMITGGSDFHGTVADFYHLGVVHTRIEPDSPLMNCTERIPLTENN